MVMNPRTHQRGAHPDFTLPRPNPNPERMTDALWWLVCMREALEPDLSENGGTYANKPGSHNIGNNLPDHGAGNSRTDHSIRDGFNRSGPWWRTKTSAHDWTFRDAQAGDFKTIKKYTGRLIAVMRNPADLRPDDVYFYTLGQLDNDRVVEGYNERDDDDEYSGDLTHLWHRHDSFRRNIIGSFPHMWKALTIDMGWTYAEWLESTRGGPVALKKHGTVDLDGLTMPILTQGDDDRDFSGYWGVRRAQMLAEMPIEDCDAIYGPQTAAAVGRKLRRPGPVTRIDRDEWMSLVGMSVG